MNFYARVYAMTRQIPRGRIATYGQIASLCGNPRAARQVGWALHALDRRSEHKNIPWQRVVNRHGMITIINEDHPQVEQVLLLQKEGVEVAKKEGNYFVDIKKFLWKKENQQTQRSTG